MHNKHPLFSSYYIRDIKGNLEIKGTFCLEIKIKLLSLVSDVLTDL